MVLNEQELVCPNFINLSMREIKKNKIIWASLLDTSSALGCRTEHGTCTVYIYKNFKLLS